jgi:hypothetical protein
VSFFLLRLIRSYGREWLADCLCLYSADMIAPRLDWSIPSTLIHSGAGMSVSS